MFFKKIKMSAYINTFNYNITDEIEDIFNRFLAYKKSILSKEEFIEFLKQDHNTIKEDAIINLENLIEYEYEYDPNVNYNSINI